MLCLADAAQTVSTCWFVQVSDVHVCFLAIGMLFAGTMVVRAPKMHVTGTSPLLQATQARAWNSTPLVVPGSVRGVRPRKAEQSGRQSGQKDDSSDLSKRDSSDLTSESSEGSKALFPALQNNSAIVSLASVTIGVSAILLKAASTETALEGRLKRVEEGQKEVLQSIAGLNDRIFSVLLNAVPKPAPPVK